MKYCVEAECQLWLVQIRTVSILSGQSFLLSEFAKEWIAGMDAVLNTNTADRVNTEDQGAYQNSEQRGQNAAFQYISG